MLPLYFFPIIEQSLQLYGTFFSFAGALLMALPVIYFILPETRGLKLEEIQDYFRQQN